MPRTVVPDSQLQLDPITTQDPRVESAAPSWVWRETDLSLPFGLWRARAESNNIDFEFNSAVGGDFSTKVLVFRLVNNAGTGKISAFADLENSQDFITSKSLQFSGTLSAPDGSNSLYRKTTTNRLVFRDNAAADQIVQYQSDTVVRETPSGALNGVNDTFTLANTPVTGTEQVYLNGILQEPGGSDDYTISGDTITFNTPPIATDRLRVTYLK